MADSGMPAVWRLSSEGELLSEVILQVEGMGQVAKIRKDLSSGFVACSTAWGRIGLMDIQVAALVKISNSFDIEWSQVKRQKIWWLQKHFGETVDCPLFRHSG